MTNKAGARRAQENLYVARQSKASAAFGQRQAQLRQQMMLAKAREARELARAKAAAKAEAEKAARAAADGPSAQATRLIGAPVERVFAAWTDAETLRGFYAPVGEALGMGKLVSVFVDARIGGGFRFVWLRGGKRVEQRGAYLELVSPSRLSFGWDIALPAKERVEITFRADGVGCEVRIAHVTEPGYAGELAPLEAAWAQVLGSLAAALEGAA